MGFIALVEPLPDVINEQPHFLRQVPVTRIDSPDVATTGLEPLQNGHQLALVDGIYEQKVRLAHDAQAGYRCRDQRFRAIRMQAAGYTHVMCLPTGVGEAPGARRTCVRVCQHVMRS